MGVERTEARHGSEAEPRGTCQDTGRPAAQGRDASVVYLSQVETPLGTMLLGATGEGVCLLEFEEEERVETQRRGLARRLDCSFLSGTNEHSARLERELEAYFAGTLREFTTPLLFLGTAFQERVWRALRTIPYGETRSYAEQAQLLEAPGAVRAVARANGDNRLAIVIPCHRVIGADGKLTGYGGGLWRKEWLLRHEGAAGGEDTAQIELGLA